MLGDRGTVRLELDDQDLRDSFGMVSAAAEGWDGPQPLRSLES